MASHTQEQWLTLGTACGFITLYDMRFLLPVNSLQHPAGKHLPQVKRHLECYYLPMNNHKRTNVLKEPSANDDRISNIKMCSST